jgi:hypothetical protein
MTGVIVRAGVQLVLHSSRATPSRSRTRTTYLAITGLLRRGDDRLVPRRDARVSRRNRPRARKPRPRASCYGLAKGLAERPPSQKTKPQKRSPAYAARVVRRGVRRVLPASASMSCALRGHRAGCGSHLSDADMAAAHWTGREGRSRPGAARTRSRAPAGCSVPLRTSRLFAGVLCGVARD